MRNKYTCDYGLDFSLVRNFHIYVRWFDGNSASLVLVMGGASVEYGKRKTRDPEILLCATRRKGLINLKYDYLPSQFQLSPGRMGIKTTTLGTTAQAQAMAMKKKNVKYS